MARQIARVARMARQIARVALRMARQIARVARMARGTREIERIARQVSIQNNCRDDKLRHSS